MADKKKNKKLETIDSAPIAQVTENINTDINNSAPVIEAMPVEVSPVDIQQDSISSIENQPETSSEIKDIVPETIIDTPIDEIPELNSPDTKKTEEIITDKSVSFEAVGESFEKTEISSEPDKNIEEIKEDKIAEIKEEKIEKVKKEPSKFSVFIKNHKVPVVIICVALVIALAVVITLFAVNKNYIFVSSAEDFAKETEGKTTYVIKADVTVNGDLTIPSGMNIDLNKNTLTVSGKLIYGADAGNNDIYIGDKKGILFLDNGKLIAETLEMNSPNAVMTLYAPVAANFNITAKILKVKNTVETSGAGSLIINTAETVTLNKAVTVSGDAGLLQINSNSTNILDVVNAGGTASTITITSPNLLIDGNLNAVTIYINNSGLAEGSVSAINSVVNGTLNITSSMIKFGANSAFTVIIADNLTTLDISGDISVSLTGGLLVIYNSGASCPLTYNTITLHIYENTEITEIDGAGTVLFYTTLETPSDITVSQEGASFICYVAAVNNAENYVLIIDGTELLPSATNTIDITTYITEPGKHTIAAKAISSNLQLLSSGLKTIDYTYNVKIATPSITLNQTDGYKVVFTQVPFAARYDYSINNSPMASYTTFTEGNPVEITITDAITSAGVYVVKIIAYGENDDAFTCSETATLSFVKTAALDSVTLSSLPISIVKDGTNLTLDWDAVANGNYYSVLVNDVLVLKTKNTSYTWTLGELSDNDTVKVIADSHSYYLASASSNAIYQYEQLTAPVIDSPYIIGDNIVLNWEAVANAASYTIFKDGVQVGDPLTATIYTVEYLPANVGTYTVTASAEFFRSATSEQAVIAAPTLNAPSISSEIAGTDVVISWAAVANATSYEVYKVGEPDVLIYTTITLSEVSYTFTYTEGGSYYVKALANGYSGSANSNVTIVPAP